MSLFDDLPDPVAECKCVGPRIHCFSAVPLKRHLDDEDRDEAAPTNKRPHVGKVSFSFTLLRFPIDLIGLLVGMAAEKGEREEMQDEHLNLPNFMDQIAAGAYLGEAYAILLIFSHP